MSEELTMENDALIDGWYAYVAGQSNGFDRMSRPDQTVIEMLHART